MTTSLGSVTAIAHDIGLYFGLMQACHWDNRTCLLHCGSLRCGSGSELTDQECRQCSAPLQLVTVTCLCGGVCCIAWVAEQLACGLSYNLGHQQQHRITACRRVLV
jgi:hypothetical protein